MTEATLHPTLIFYRRPGCHLCDDAETLLRDELAQRARAGLVTATVKQVDVSADPELEARYGTRIPVFAIDDAEVDLVINARQVREFLTTHLPTLA